MTGSKPPRTPRFFKILLIALLALALLLWPIAAFG